MITLSAVLVPVLPCCCRDNVKYGLFVKHLFQRKQEHGGWKKCQDNNELLLKITSLVIKWNKRNSSKQVIPITYLLEKRGINKCCLWE